MVLAEPKNNEGLHAEGRNHRRRGRTTQQAKPYPEVAGKKQFIFDTQILSPGRDKYQKAEKYCQVSRLFGAHAAS